MNHLSALDPLISSLSLLKHPFYQKWSKGELSRDDLRIYAKEYFHLVQRIPGIVARVAERAQDSKTKDMIAKNVREEQEHVQLWKRFAKSLDVSEQELVSHRPSGTARAAVKALEAIAEQGFAQGVSAVYALELELPAIAKTKKEGLCDFYSLESKDAHIYFDEHLKEEEHLNVWRALDTGDHNLEPAARSSMEAQNKMLDSVCEICGISMQC
ncbi:hypothetical protein A2706_01895 [Candidatus Peribacteria bacterium RIFCSPHIGHO2_01_FULL_51_35]|nr:MAG: hypothetical protein A2706_01895 [Candidatus Peribacteria bacterium RIFCSPHIGHO2_01_FULL_51_35]